MYLSHKIQNEGINYYAGGCVKMAKSNLRGTFRDVSKLYNKYKRLSEEGRRVRVVKDVYSKMSEQSSEYQRLIQRLGREKGFDVEKLGNYSVNKIIKNEKIWSEFQKLEKSLIRKERKSGKKFAKTKGEIRKQLKRHETKSMQETYKYYLQDEYYKALYNTLTYEEFNEIMAEAYEKRYVASDVDIKKFQKATEIYDEIQRRASGAIKDERFSGWVLNKSSQKDSSGGFFTKNKGYNVNESDLRSAIIKIVEKNVNISVDDAIKEILNKKELTSKIKTHSQELMNQLGKLK